MGCGTMVARNQTRLIGRRLLSATQVASGKLAADFGHFF